MSVKIHPITSLITTCYIIQESGMIMVDAGFSINKSNIIQQVKKLKINPAEIKLIILTHGDFDHVGAAKYLKEFSGAKVAIHISDHTLLETGKFNWPKGVGTWGKISRMIMLPLIRKMAAFPAMKADIILDDDDFDLSPFGIHGRIIHTPGHTPGSISVLLESGELFAGCLAHNRMPFTLKPSLPVYAEHIETIKASWRKVISAGAQIVYPGHGKPFPVEAMLKYLD